MAGALVGGSVLSAFLQVMFDRMASHEFVGFFKAQKLDDELLTKLKITMRSINRLLDDAEEKQITNRDVRTWIDDLKDAVYEADDLLDEISYEGLRTELELAGSSQTSIIKVRNFLSSRSPIFNKERPTMKMEAKLKRMIGMFKELIEQKGFLGLGEYCIGEKIMHKTPTTSLVDESGVYGRNDDREAIVRLLFPNKGKSLGVIPVVGMCGVGKTTLSQLVYNDSRVEEWFDLKTWVCASEEFGVFKIAKDILKELGSKNCDSKTQNQLHLELKERLKGKKFLLVLDDVWNVKYDDWDILQTPLKFAQECKIIVTTQSERVASVLSTVPTYHLKGLTDDDCWFLFEKHAFDDGGSSAHPGLEAIGREIVRKCQGLPLAIKSLGGLLRSKRDAEDWEKILRSNLWDLHNINILPALRLSYHYLPSHLKRCFAYCAIFPKDYKFTKEEIVHLWMAEGFLIQLQENTEMEEVGDEYFCDLVSRSFFQQSSSHPSCFMMHDLINDLAKFVSGEFCFTLEDDDSTCKLAKKTRHLSFLRTKDGILDKFKTICGAQPLRTFFLVEQSWEFDHNDNEALNVLLPTLKRLRVLSLSQYSYVNELPDSISSLKHLRYLNFFRASIKNLSRIVHTLYNLQTLILRECRDLVELPDSIRNLKRLRYLDLFGTSIRRLPDFVTSLCNLQTLILCQCKDLIELPANMGCLTSLHNLDIRETSLREMPLEMGRLKNLRMLTRFINTGSRIKELGELIHLRGTLEIWNLENVIDAEDALKANLKSKKYMQNLQLRWNGDTDNSAHERLVLDKLQPHTNVECLSIIDYGGTTFPDWVGDSSFSNIASLMLSGCKYCSSLPPLGQLASLKYLIVQDFDGVVVIGPEFYGSCLNPFGNLEELRFEGLTQLHEWIPHEGGAFPLLRELYIKECPKLSKNLPGRLPCLTTLEIEGCQQLVATLPRSPSTLRLKLDDDSRDVLVTKLPSGLHGLRVDGFNPIGSLLEGVEKMGVLSTTLEEIEIRNCGSLVSFPLQLFSELKSFQISECPNLESLVASETRQESFTSLISLNISVCPNLTLLRLWNCSSLKSLPERMSSILPSLEILQIVNCPELVSFPEGGLPSKLQSLQIRNCRNLIASRMLWNLQTLQCLSHFSFGEYEDMESFPEKTLLPSTLITLGIWDLPNLKSLDYEGLQQLTSLTQLRISHCSNLQSMPREGLPSSLSSLTISECPILEQRCQPNEGEDWPKISHIPDIDINWSI